jgi:hypothetical protein
MRDDVMSLMTRSQRFSVQLVLLFAENCVPDDLILHILGVPAGITMGLGVYIAAYQDRFFWKEQRCLAADTA